MFHQRSGLHLFTAFGIDVFVSLWYLLLMAFIVFSPGFGSGATAATGMVHGVIFGLAVTLSLLVHEYGHGFVSKSYRLDPSIMLHAFGGFCAHRPADSDADDAKILLAGPGAGLVFGGLAVAAQMFLVPAVGSSLFGVFVRDLVWVNIVWSLANLLLPIWPLDGGKLFHLLLRRWTDSAAARKTTLQISLATIVVGGAVAVALFKSLFLGLLAFFLVMENVRLLRSGQPLVERAAPDNSDPSDFQSELLEEAREALEAGNAEEAYRLCHQLRAGGGNLGPDLLDEIWTILGVASTELGKLDEAESYLDRAPDSNEVEQARQEWEAARARSDEEDDEAA